MASCPALASGELFLSSLLRHVDCQGQTLGLVGWQALADPASPVSMALSGLLVIFVALFGYRMALGHGPSARDAVTAAVRIGIVLTLAGSWPAYRVMVYDVVVQSPAEVSRMFGGAAEAAGTSGDLIDRLQRADQAIVRLTNLGTGRDATAALPPQPGASPDEPAQRFPIADDPAFGWARIFFLSSTVAAFAIVRLTAGVLLALAPLFAGLLLFGAAKGLLVGWARALAFSILASITTTFVLGVQLALLEPWLTQTVSLRRAGDLAAAAPVELLVLCLAFALALFGSMAVLLRLTFMSEASLPWRRAAASGAGSIKTLMSTRDLGAPEPAPRRNSPPSRVVAIADAVRASQRREVLRRTSATSTVVGGSKAASAPETATDELAIPTLNALSRRSRPRTSLAAALRDART